jgi:hypothetical protein
LFEIKDQLATDLHHEGGGSTDLRQGLLEGLFILLIKINIFVAKIREGLLFSVGN